jgi:hypothetical protein
MLSSSVHQARNDYSGAAAVWRAGDRRNVASPDRYSSPAIIFCFSSLMEALFT